VGPRGDAERFAALWTAAEPDLEALVSLVGTVGRDAPDPGALLDGLAERVSGSVGDGVDGGRVLAVLFGGDGLRGDRSTYGSPDNSLVDRVLLRRLGIPLSLSVVAVLVGRRLGVPFDAVGMPRHVLLRDPVAGTLHDVFDGARILDATGAAELLARIDPGTPWRSEFLESMTAHEIVDRWCRNLRVARTAVGDGPGVDRIVGLELSRPDPPPDAVVVAVGRAAGRGAFAEAASLLERHAPAGPAGVPWRERAQQFRARLN